MWVLILFGFVFGRRCLDEYISKQIEGESDFWITGPTIVLCIQQGFQTPMSSTRINIDFEFFQTGKETNNFNNYFIITETRLQLTSTKGLTQRFLLLNIQYKVRAMARSVSSRTLSPPFIFTILTQEYHAKIENSKIEWTKKKKETKKRNNERTNFWKERTLPEAATTTH